MNNVLARHDTRRRLLEHIVLTPSNERELEQTTMSCGTSGQMRDFGQTSPCSNIKVSVLYRH
eukprot:COSAG04_NODE_3647_length_2640_cov_14.093270_3_plen_62_part_00